MYKIKLILYIILKTGEQALIWVIWVIVESEESTNHCQHCIFDIFSKRKFHCHAKLCFLSFFNALIFFGIIHVEHFILSVALIGVC